jgi:glycosyltransferase involved in cell wall biosynthesis
MNLGVSICIPTHNASIRILPTLQSVERAVSVVKEQANIETLVIGSACTDNTIDIVESFWKNCDTTYSRRFVEEDRPGAGIARLRAFHETKSQIIVYCDDDVVPDVNTLKVIIHTASTEESVGVGGGIILPELINGAEWPEWIDDNLKSSLALRPLFNDPVYSPPNDHPRYFPVSAFAWYRRQSLQRWAQTMSKQKFVLGPTGKKMWRADDLEMDYFVLDSGYKIKLDPQIRAWHRIPPIRLTPEYYRSLMYWVGRSMQRLRNRRNPKAWNFCCGSLLNKILSAPYKYSKIVLQIWLTPERKIRLHKCKNSGEINRLMHLAYEIGVADEMLMKIITPWRY